MFFALHFMDVLQRFGNPQYKLFILQHIKQAIKTVLRVSAYLYKHILKILHLCQQITLVL